MSRPTIRPVGYAVILLWCVRGVLQAGTVQVTADHVNLRAGPGPDTEVVAQAAMGSTLESSDRREGEWLEVVPPTGTVLWVYAELVQDDTSAVDDLRVRGGPGINYRAVGKLGKGDKVDVQGRDGDWLRIAPTADARLWVNGQFVRSIEAAEGATLPDAVPAPPIVETRMAEIPQPQGVMAASPVTKPPAHPRPTLISDASARATRSEPRVETWAPPPGAPGVSVRYVGVLRPVGVSVWRRPSRYRLIYNDSLGRAVTRCYVVAPPSDLEHGVGHDVELVGRQYEVRGVRHPVVVSESIQIR